MVTLPITRLAEQTVTLDEFERWLRQPENANRDFEFIGGRIVEVVSNNYSSQVAMLIGARLTVYVVQHDLGYVTGADGGYQVGGERYIPDVAFVSRSRQPEACREAYNPLPPDLAVEVLSPANDPAEIRVKLINYGLVGTAVWVVDPERQRAEIYLPGQPPQMVGMDGELSGGEAVPGFRLKMADIFR
ncbi:MAG: Uma2 family endonuclease [Anaerolineae bacterium]|nr:Uma2 family endonuclease [Anaerolineae bacterium]